MPVEPDPEAPGAPVAPARPHVLRHGGDERVDPWFWLGQRDDPEVLDHLRAENDHTAATTAHLAGLRAQIYEEIVGRVQETDASSPTPKGPYEYFTRTIEGRQYAVHCRRPRIGAHVLPDPFAAPGTAEGEVIVVDENELAAGHDYFSVGDLVLAPGQRLVAVSADLSGGERHTLHFRDVDAGVMLDDVVPDVYYGVAWADDSTVLYTRPDDAMRPWQVWRHTLGTPAGSDVLVFQEDDDRFYVTVGRTRTGRYLVITTASKVTSEVWLVPTADPGAAPVVVEPREQGHEYHVEHHEGPAGDRLYVLTNAPVAGGAARAAAGESGAGAANFALMITATATPGRSHWQEVLPARVDVRLDDVDAFARHLVVSERGGGLERLRVLRLGSDGGVTDDHLVAMPDAVYSVWTGANLEYDTDILRYQYTSLVAPTTAFDFDVTTSQSTLVKRQPVPGYDPSRYESRRLWATASDGTRVPISVVWRPDARHDGGHPGPLLLYGYGSYEVSIDPTFSVGRVSLLDRGVAFAIAHVRGGGEMGRAWYDDGKLLHKRNTFTDFVACAEHLVAEGWTSPEQLAIRGGSAGGLLMGAVTNLRPDLFRVVVAEVPFVDCLTTILDDSLPLTVTEWEEWGDPLHDPAVYEYMKSYSPYDNVVPGTYPAMLVTGGLNDPRVQYWEPAKWVAKLRAVRTDDRALLLKMEMGAGHSGPSGRYEVWRDEAFVLSFVLDQLGLAHP